MFPKKMMIATDGSKHSLDAAKKAAQIAKTNKSDAIIVHVLQPFKHLKTQPGPMDVGGGFSVEKEHEIKEPKTRLMTAVLNKLGLYEGVLILTDKKDKNIELAARNIPNVKVLHFKNLNLYDLLKYKNLLMTENGAKLMPEVLG